MATATTRAASKIKLFQLTQKYYHDIGIFPSQMQPNSHFNWNNVLILCVCAESFVAILAYFFFEAKTMIELAMTFYTSTAVLSAICYTLINIYQRDDIFRTIEHFEEFIEQRKLTFLGIFFIS